MDVRRVVAGLGRTLISAGVLILLFVAYQLWGTGLAEARAQADLKDDFEQALQAPTTTTTAPTGQDDPGDEPVVEESPTPTPDRPASAPEGSAVAVIRIPRIGIEKAVVEGVGVGHLKKGPGHYPTTPLPGQPGNAAIAGHRTTYGAPFHDLDELRPGDPIFVTTRQGRFRYEVSESKIVAPSQTEVLAPTDDNRLTLTTCHPRYSARQRLIVVAALVGEAAEPPPPPPEAPPAGPEAGVDDGVGDPPLDEGAPDEGAVEEGATLDEPSLSGDPAARGPALAWGAAAGLVWLLAWLAARRWRRWPAYLLAAPVFFVVLFLFFENVARLFPANV